MCVCVCVCVLVCDCMCVLSDVYVPRDATFRATTSINVWCIMRGKKDREDHLLVPEEEWIEKKLRLFFVRRTQVVFA